MKKSATVLSVCMLLLFSSSIFASAADDIAGIWKTADTEFGYSHIEIYKQNDKYNGRIIYLSMPDYSDKEQKRLAGKVVAGQARIDINNPDKNKRQRSVLGLKIVSDFVFNGAQWRGGTVYDPESGKTYKGKMWLNRNGTLGLRGYVGISAFGRSTVWTRVEQTETVNKELELDKLPDVLIEKAGPESDKK